MIKIDEFLEIVEKHGSDDLSNSCETCVQIKNGIKIIDEALKLRESVNEELMKINDEVGHISLQGTRMTEFNILQTLKDKSEK